MMLVDTHTHLYLPEFDADRHEVMDRAIESGVEKMIFPNVDLGTIAPMRALHEAWPSNTFMAMGLHPTEVNAEYKNQISQVLAELDGNAGDYVAVGEIGIDLYWDKTYRREQMEAFDTQVGWAVERDLPVIIHCREGLDETLEVLQNYNGRVKGVFHSFGGTQADVEAVRRVGDFYFGVNGIVTFKNCNLRDTLPAIGLDRILLETDAPYLAPVPHRGKRNETAYITKTAEAVANAFGITPEAVAGATTHNASMLFGMI